MECYFEAEAGTFLQNFELKIEVFPSHTSVLVSRLFGISFTQLLRRKRMEKVENYLASTDFSLREIAARCGFSGEFHLNKALRSVRGIPPGRFRREFQAKTFTS